MDDSTRNKLTGLAQKWIDRHLKCAQRSNEEKDSEKPPPDKCEVDGFDNAFFQLTGRSPIQFVLSAHGPFYSRIGDNGYQGCDQEFILFAWQKGKLSEKVLYQTSVDDSPDDQGEDAYTEAGNALSFIDFPDGSKGLLLNTNRGGSGTMGHLFLEAGGEVKDVLDFQEAERYVGRYDGWANFESVLEPTAGGGLKFEQKKIGSTAWGTPWK